MKKTWLFTVFVSLFYLFIVLGCANHSTSAETDHGSITPPDDIYELKPERLFSPDSPFNTPIPENPEIDPNSETMVQSIQRAYREDNAIILGLKEWTVTLYYADDSTPRYNVALTADWAPSRVLEGVPIPDGAVPDPEDDGHMAIIDLTTGIEYDFWQASFDGTNWSASWGNKISIHSNGIYPEGLSCRGSGFALTAGMIWPEELRDGHIDHALIFSYNAAKENIIAEPATETDGWGDSPYGDGIPEGARIQLDPALDLNSLDLQPWERTIARALQEYGMILADNSGGLELEAINKLSYPSDPYEGIVDQQWHYGFIRNIPLDSFRVLKMDTRPQY